MTDTSPILAVLPSRCPSRQIGLDLPLATIEEIDLLAARYHISREQILRQIINAALLSDAPHWPLGPDPIGRLAEHAYLTVVRSYELAGDPESEVRSTAPSPEPGARMRLSMSAAATKTHARRVGGLAAPIVADASRRRTGPDQALDPQGATMPQHATPTVSRTALALNIPVGEAREQQQDALWAMSPTERVAAMWRGDLTLYQLSRWTSRAQHEVPLVGGEFAWIVMRTPEWAEAADDLSDNVIYLTERQDDRAAA
jgi:hypothetical protein